MTNDPRHSEPGDLPDTFVDSLDSCIFGVISIEKMRRRIASLLSEHQDWGPDMLMVIDDAYRKGKLNAAAYQALVTEIDLATTEDEPTEWSEETQAEFGSLASETPTSATPPILTSAVKSAEPVFELKGVGTSTDIGPGTLLRDRYVLQEKIGTGSMGSVYRALDREKESAGSVEPWVAIKIVSEDFARNPSALQALKQEAAHGDRLVHPNIIRVFDFDWDGDHYFITMEWLQGRPLVDILNEQRFQPLPMERAVSIIEGLCHGLAHAHAEGVIHSDIKPGNVFITRAGHAKLLDFGIARLATGAPGDFDATGIGAHTPAYSSCEVLEGAAPEPIDDVYSLGCLAYRLLAGRRAYGGSTALDAEAGKVELKPIPALNESQRRALERALAWRRIDRTPDVATFLAEFLGHATVDMTLPMPPEPATDRPRAPAGHPRVPLRYAAPALALILIALAAFLWWPGSGERTTVASAKAPQPAAPIRDTSAPAADVAPVPGDEAPADTVPPADEATSADDTADAPPADEAPPADDAPPAEAAPAAEALVNDAADVESGVEPGARSEATPAPEDPDAERAEALLDEANRRMDDGRLLGAEDDSAYPLIVELGEVAPDSAELQQARLRLANLMLLEAMVAINDEDFGRAAEWIEQTRALGVPDSMTARYDAELADARDAKTERESESLGAIFASATPAAILADPEVSFEPESAAPDAMGGPESTALAMALPGGAAARQPAAVDAAAATPEPAPEPELTPLSALEFRRFVKPQHPRGTVVTGKEGWVEVRFDVDEKGRTSDVRVVSSEPAGVFEQAALGAVRKWRFRPHRVDGEVTATESGVRLRFEVEN